MSNRSRAEKKGHKPRLSIEAEAQVQVITDRVVPVSFSKLQRKEVQQAIEKGMESIRSQTKSNNRDRDKKVKKLQAQLEAQLNKQHHSITSTENQKTKNTSLTIIIPWSLLILSWLAFAIYSYVH